MDTETAYNLALDYLYSFVDYSLKHVSELAKADFNLDRMFALMDALGNPQNAYPIIHVAGTKGKGSTSALCASALTAAGYKVGLYTSPHLEDYIERIQIDGSPLAHEQLVALVDAVKPAVAKIPKLTTFEITTAIGFLAFERAGVDAAVIEVGLGGRLDATNVITPRVSVITSLSMDHTAVLGNTLAKIAGEKAGIIKDAVPVVSSPQKEEALEVLLRVARERSTSLTLVERDVTFEFLSSSLDGQEFAIYPTALSGARRRPNEVEGQAHATILAQETRPSTACLDTATSTPTRPSAQDGGLVVNIPLLGSHQLTNAVTAYAALKASGLSISDEAIQKGFSQVKWPARFEVARREPPVVIDSAHNRESAQRLREALDDYFPSRPVYMVFCSLEDKDISGILEELRPRLEGVIATRADHPRAPSVEWIAQQVRQAEIPVVTEPHAAAALERALEMAGDLGLVLSAGSVAFAGEIRAAWRKKQSV